MGLTAALIFDIDDDVVAIVVGYDDEPCDDCDDGFFFIVCLRFPVAELLNRNPRCSVVVIGNKIRRSFGSGVFSFQ